MKRFWLIFILILALCMAVFETVSLPFAAKGPAAQNGILDLQGQDFTDTVFELSGQWELYYGQLKTPGNFQESPSAECEWIDLPGSWTQLDHPELGFATYRLTIQTDSNTPLMLYVPEIISAARIYVNGELLLQTGQVGTDKAASHPAIHNDLLTLLPQDGQLELVVQASNYHLVASGLYYPLLIGRETVLIHHLFWQRTIAAAALGGILLIGVYHLFLYSFRRQQRLYLTFSLICLTSVLRLALETNSFVQFFLPNGMNLFISRVFLLLFMLHSLCISLFMLQVFAIRLPRWLKEIYWACLLLPAAAIVFLPFSLAASSMFLVLPAYIMALVLALRTKKIGRDPYYLLYFGSMVGFIVCAPLTKTVLEGALFLPGIAPNLFLILSQCVILSRNYAETMTESERLNANLENLVQQRTSELHTTNEQLAASQTALREMISAISHDLKTPLTVLNNYLELLGDNALSADEQERLEYLSIAYQKNLDLQRLIQTLFEVTRLESGNIVYNLEWFPVPKLMEEAQQKYAELLRDQEVCFTVHTDTNCMLQIDSSRIWSVLDNLIYNALRYTPAGGSISLTARRMDTSVQLQIADTGQGISAEHLPHIFERFYKVSIERGEKDGTSGLGLYIVKTTVEAMDGTVSVESQPGQGTVFTLTFLAK